jgi:hypothetical protein
VTAEDGKSPGDVEALGVSAERLTVGVYSRDAKEVFGDERHIKKSRVKNN